MAHVGWSVTLAVGAAGVDTELKFITLVGAEGHPPAFVTVQE
jgi:hypothetical protein